jgi:hypothetical protein
MRAREGSSRSFDGPRWLRANGAARLFAALALIVGAAQGGEILDWYSVPPTAGNPGSGTLGGTGTWNTLSNNWSENGVTFSSWDNSANNTAVFEGPAGTVTLGTGITVGGLTFDSNYVLTGNTLTLAANSTINAAVGTSTAIQSAVAVGAGVLVQGAGALNISGVLSGTTGGLTYAGTGTLTLSGGGGIDSLNENSGGVKLTAGTLTLTNTTAAIDVAGGALTISGGATVNATAPSVYVEAFGAGATVTATGAGTTLNGLGTYFQSDDGGSIAVSNGAAVNSHFAGAGYDYSGTMNISSGGAVTDNLGNLGAFGTGTATVAGTGSIWANQTLDLGGDSREDLSYGTGTLNINGGGSVTVAGATTLWTSSSSISINGGSLTTGQLVGTTGTINLQANPAGGSALVLTGGTGTATFAGTITGAGGISQTGGNQILTGINPYTGQTLVSGGTLTQQGGSNNSQITVGNGAVFNAVSTTLSPLNGFGIIATQPGGLVQYDGATVNGGFLEGTGHSIIGEGATFTGTTITLGALVTQNAAATMNVVTLNGTIDNNATLTWSGGTIGSGGVLNVNSLVNATGLVTNGEVNIFDGATLAGSGSDLVLGGGSRTYVGSLANPGGTLSETGGTIELNGGLLVNNGTVEGTLDVNFGGLAEGAGTYGAVNITNGGVFHPGNSPGTVTSTSATFGAGGGFDFDIDNAIGTEGTNWSFWDITDTLTITAGTTPNSQFTIYLDSLTAGEAPGPLENFNAADSYSWTILDADEIDGFAADEFALNTTGFDEALDGGRFSLESNGQDLTLDFTAAAATPEPGTVFLLGGGLFVLALRKRVWPWDIR